MTIEQAFNQAIYRVDAPGGAIRLRVGRRAGAARLRARLPAHGDGWVITPCNPRAKRMPRPINDRRLDALHALLARQRRPWLSACNLEPHGDWPDEPGAYIYRIPAPVARSIAVRFGQAALLRVPRHKPPELVWLEA